MKELIQSPLFYFGLIAKFALILLLSPAAVTDLYVPFLENSVVSGSFDPWSSWLANSGTFLAFPYGYSMWLTFLPLSLLSEIIGIPLEYGYSLTLLLCDFALLCVLNKIVDNRQRLVLFGYWLSPVMLLASYGLGLNDVVPALYLMIGILFLKFQRLTFTGVFFALAISAKLSMLIVFPFVILYLYNNKPLRQLIYDFGVGFISAFGLVILPFLLSSSAMMMLSENPEMANILGLSFDVGKGVVIYFMPVFFALILYLVWRVRRLNFDLFMAVSGVVFLIVVVLMPAASGWFVWTVPFLVFYQALSGRISVIMIAVFSGFFVVSRLVKETFYLINGSALDLSFALTQVGFFRAEQMLSMIDTGIFAIGIILAVRMWRESISDNAFFRKSREPFVIGIAGDSGAGKDTFAEAISGLFGNHSIVSLSGDDYHLWDRHKPMWQVMTHLNPMANDLERFSRDLLSLKDGKSIRARYYNHATGKMDKSIKRMSNDFIIASGLHALYLPQLRDSYNLKIFLDIDEDLRRFFKIERDVGVRGHSIERVIASLEDREPDANKFIRSQKRHADLVLSLQPTHHQILNDVGVDPRKQLKVVATTFNGISELALNRVLVGLCGLHVDMTISNDGSEVSMTVEGEASTEDIDMAAKVICPNIFEFFDISPKWCDGVLGIMQLIAVSHINQVLTHRFAK
jgi:uridine kinase